MGVQPTRLIGAEIRRLNPWRWLWCLGRSELTRRSADARRYTAWLDRFLQRW